MTTAEVQTSRLHAAIHAPRRTVDSLRFRWILAAGWLVVILAGLTLGERTSSLQDLESAVASGQVHEVEVSGGLAPGERGFETVQLRWHTRFGRHLAEVTETSSRRAVKHEGYVTHPVVVGDVTTSLLAQQPGLRIDRTPVHWQDSTFRRWQLPDWIWFAGFLLSLATLGLLITGPEPWRATRWAWFWLWGILPPLGLLAFLVLSGPTPPLRSPRRRRLTGGWAFLIALLLGALT